MPELVILFVAMANAAADARPKLAGLGTQLVLGISLARRGFLVGASLAIGAVTTLALMGLAASYARRGAEAPVQSVPILASGALAWGAGFLLAFSASARVLRRDRADGVRQLLRWRGLGLARYLGTRVGGLAALLAIVVAGGTALVGASALAVGAKLGTARDVAQSTGAALAYAVAFSLVVAPLAVAAVGARSRMGGYFFLAAVLFLPEMAATWLEAMLPHGLAELFAIPSALAALRTSLAPGSVDGWRALRSVLALAVFVALALAAVRREITVVDREAEAP